MIRSKLLAIEPVEAVLGRLREAHLLRGALYLGLGAAVMQGMSTRFRRSDPHTWSIFIYRCCR